MGAATSWERSLRRAPGENPYAADARRDPGPWHAYLDGQAHTTACGKRLRMVSTDRRTDPPPSADRTCPTCSAADTDGVQRPVRGRR